METKICRTCNVEKPLSDFYHHRPTKDGYHGSCKDCCKNYQAIRRRKKSISRKTERLAVAKLRSVGIFAVEGTKSKDTKWIDVVAWGCVRIEVKFSKPSRDKGSYGFSLRSTLNKKTDFPHLIMLVLDNEDEKLYHLFDINHDVFMHNNQMKQSVAYMPNAHHRKNRRSIITPEIMQAHRDNWGLIEQVRLNVIDQLTGNAYKAERVKQLDLFTPVFDNAA